MALGFQQDSLVIKKINKTNLRHHPSERVAVTGRAGDVMRKGKLDGLI